MVERIVARRRGAGPGPTLIVVGGLHGNEPAGVRAARRVLEGLDGAALRGEVVALAGNRRALAEGRRFVARDLNRQWSPAALAAPPAGDAEDAERSELKAAIDEALAAARGPVYFLDLHTTSAPGVPFALIADVPRHRAFAAAFPLPVILGLEELIEGVLAEYLTSRGATTLSVEGGQHASAAAQHNLEASVVIALATAGLCAPPGVAEARAVLARARGALPRVAEVLERHHIDPGDGFRMEPGFANIGVMRAGELLARDRRGEIRAARDGLLLLPLYQTQGEDGYFVARAIGPCESSAALLARRAGVDRLLGWLPGVRRAGPDRLVVARPWPHGLFRFFGYRRAEEGGKMLSRRA